MTVEAHGASITSSQTTNQEYGFTIVIGATPVYLTSITRVTGCTGTRATLWDTSDTLLATGESFSGDTSTFASPPLMAASTTYYVIVGSNGSNYTRYYKDSGQAFPYEGTYLNWTSGGTVIGGDAQNDVSLNNVASITVEEGLDVTATPSALALSLTETASVSAVVSVPSALAMTLGVGAPTPLVFSPVSAITLSLTQQSEDATIYPSMLSVGISLSLPTPTIERIQRPQWRGELGEAVIRTNYPIEEGLTAETQKQTGRVMNLIPQYSSLKTTVPRRHRRGI